jgi:hydroxypyruvate reductase
MARAFASALDVPLRTGLVVDMREESVPPPFALQRGAHPVPDEGSVEAGRQALELARNARGGRLVVLLSGGASSMLAVPASALGLEDKQGTIRRLLREDATIHEINTVRKHLSAIKGGRLAEAAVIPVLTLAISDVVGDDLTVIGSGPAVPDPTTYGDALAVLDKYGRETFPRPVVDHLTRGDRGGLAETPKPHEARARRWQARVIGSARDAVESARDAASRLGYPVLVLEEPVTGEARLAAARHVQAIAERMRGQEGACCVLSAGETTVTVRGTGRGGRNQEFALAATAPLSALGRTAILASIGTDGVDGPTDAAGAIVDSSTLARARARGLDPMRYLEANDAWTFFEALGDLVRTGVTGTNVGDLQVTLVSAPDVHERSEAL